MNTAMKPSNSRTKIAPVSHFSMRRRSFIFNLPLLATDPLLFYRYYYFSSSVALFQILKSIWHLAQGLVSPVDNRRDFAGFHKTGEECQVIVIQIRHHHAHLLTDERGSYHRFDRTSHWAHKTAVIWS